MQSVPVVEARFKGEIDAFDQARGEVTMFRNEIIEGKRPYDDLLARMARADAYGLKCRSEVEDIPSSWIISVITSAPYLPLRNIFCLPKRTFSYNVT